MPNSAADEPIPHLAFDSDALPVDQRMKAWEALSHAYDVALAPGADARDFAVRNSIWLLGDLAVSSGATTPVRLARTPERIRADGRDTVSIVFMRKGRWTCTVEDRLESLGPGQACLLDFAKPWASVGGHTDFIIVVMSRAMVQAAGCDIDRLHGFVIDGVGGRLLTEHLGSLVRHLPAAGAGDVPLLVRLARALLDEVLGGVAGTGQAAAVGADRWSRIRLHIESHLGDPHLDAGHICAALAMTRSTLYRAAQARGGVAGYIQQRRLEAAHLRLCDPEETATLTTIATNLGFHSTAHFSNSFRRRFGYSPSDARAASHGADPETDNRVRFRNWVTQLMGGIDRAQRREPVR